MLSVSPIADSMMIAPSTDSGIEMAMMTVERQLPRNSRIITLVSSAAMTPSTATPLDRAAHEQRLVADEADLQRVRQLRP